MLVEINLLPKKNKNRFHFSILFTILLCLAVVGGTLISLKYFELKQEYRNVKQNLIMTKKLYELEGEKQQNSEKPEAVIELEHAVEWAEEFPISTVFMMKQITALLPERGFIISFEYRDDNVVHIFAQFDTNREVAFYLKNLTGSKYIHKATLLQVNTVDNQESIEEMLPRYNAEFELQLNSDVLKEEGN